MQNKNTVDATTLKEQEIRNLKARIYEAQQLASFLDTGGNERAAAPVWDHVEDLRKQLKALEK